MFDSFNKNIKVIILFLVLNCFATVLSIYIEFSNNMKNNQTLDVVEVIFSTLFLLFCLYLIWKLRHPQIKTLKLCFGFCLLQIVAIESNIFTFTLSNGAKVGAVFEIGSALITIDFLALLILFLIGKVIKTYEDKANVGIPSNEN